MHVYILPNYSLKKKLNYNCKRLVQSQCANFNPFSPIQREIMNSSVQMAVLFHGMRLVRIPELAKITLISHRFAVRTPVFAKG